jgi:hypothetical protein
MSRRNWLIPWTFVELSGGNELTLKKELAALPSAVS